MVVKGGITRKELEKCLKLEAKLQELEVECCYHGGNGVQDSAEETSRAIVMAYAFTSPGKDSHLLLISSFYNCVSALL